MHPDVLQFVRFLQDAQTDDKHKLQMIVVRIAATKSSWEYCSKESKQNYYEQLQQFSDLFAHIYSKQPLREFGDFLSTIDNNW